MGLFALPNILIFQILLPLVSPLIDLMFVVGILHYFIDKHFHPEAASADSFHKLLSFFLLFLVIDFAASALAFALERKHPASKGDAWLHVDAAYAGSAWVCPELRTAGIAENSVLYVVKKMPGSAAAEAVNRPGATCTTRGLKSRRPRSL